MKTADEIYREGSFLAQDAEVARIRRLPVDYMELYRKASKLEYEAAEQMKLEGFAPSRRITALRSAAALAYKAGDFPESKRIIAIARSENPDGYEVMQLDDIEAAIQKESKTQPAAKGHFQVKGALTAADADEHQIRIRELETSRVYSFTVPDGMFRKVVKKYWLDVVLAVGNGSPKAGLTLEKISLAG